MQALSALIYSQVEIRIRQSPISRQVPAKKSIDRAPSAPYCYFNAQSLPGILSRVVIVTEDLPSCFHASFCVGDSSTFYFETESYASTRRTHLLFTANQHSS